MENKMDKLSASGAILAFVFGIVASVSMLMAFASFDMSEFHSLEWEHPGVKGVTFGSVGALVGLMVLLVGLFRARKTAQDATRSAIGKAILGVAFLALAQVYTMVLTYCFLSSVQGISFGEALPVIEETAADNVVTLIACMAVRVVMMITGLVSIYRALGDLSVEKGKAWTSVFRVTLIVLSAYSIFLIIPLVGDGLFMLLFLIISLIQLLCFIFGAKHVFAKR